MSPEARKAPAKQMPNVFSSSGPMLNLRLHRGGKLAGTRARPYDCRVRRARARDLALCGTASRSARAGLHGHARAPGPSRGAPRAGARRAFRRRAAPAPRAAACPRRRGPSGELARIARSDAPERLLVGVRAHSDLDAAWPRSCARSARRPSASRSPGCSPRPSPPGAAAVAALRDDPRVAYIERDRTLRTAADEFDTLDPFTGLKLHVGLRHRARGRGDRGGRRRVGQDGGRARHRPRREPPGVRRAGREHGSTPPRATAT